MSWTDERVENLKELWAEGMSASQIAKVLGGVTRKRCDRQGSSPGPVEPWTGRPRRRDQVCRGAKAEDTPGPEGRTARSARSGTRTGASTGTGTGTCTRRAPDTARNPRCNPAARTRRADPRRRSRTRHAGRDREDRKADLSAGADRADLQMADRRPDRPRLCVLRAKLRARKAILSVPRRGCLPADVVAPRPGPRPQLTAA